jgi:hypothetical protein
MIIAGIDKVGLTSREFRVRDLRGWSVGTGAKVGDAPPNWCRTVDGDVIEGPSFYMNTDTANFDLGPKGLRVVFNPSKVRHPYKLNTDPVDVGRIGEQVQNLLQDRGVLADLGSMQVFRTDLAKDAQLKQHPLMYGSACGAGLHGKRLRATAYPDGHRWGNTQREVNFYNKTREVLERSKLTIEPNTARMEVKLKKSRPTANTLGFYAFRDLCKADPEHLTAVYRDELNTRVFHVPPKAPQLVFSFDTDVDLFGMFMQAGNSPLRNTLEAIQMPLQGVDIEHWKAVMKASGVGDRQVRRQIADLKDRINRSGMIQKRRDAEAVTVYSLIDELKQAYAA